jgi:hypothetical protein
MAAVQGWAEKTGMKAEELGLAMKEAGSGKDNLYGYLQGRDDGRAEYRQYR